jgi:hypothetical protein
MRGFTALPLAVSLLVLASVSGNAFPAIPSAGNIKSDGSVNRSITQVRDGCGIGYNRGPLGMCRPNGFPVRMLQGALGGACPPTFHLGPFGRRCISNY